MKSKIVLTVLATSLVFSTAAQQVPAKMNYQGQLVDDTGNNLPDGNHTVVFRLYSVPAGGNSFWGPDTQEVTLFNGRFNTQLDTDDVGRRLDTSLVGQGAAYLELAVDGSPAITPRQQLLSAPYALYAGNVVNGAIGPAQLAAGAVGTAHLAPGAVTAAKLAADAAVRSVGTGPGLTGGPITGTGTIALDLNSGNHWRAAQIIETGTAGPQLFLKQLSPGAAAGLELTLASGQPWDIAAVAGAPAKLDFSMGGSSKMSVDENGLLTAAGGMFALLGGGSIYSFGSIAADGVDLQGSRGLALSASHAPMLTRGYDPFDGTAGPEKQGIGRWGMFMEPSRLVLGMPDLSGRYFEVAKYWLNGARTPLMTVGQDGGLWAAGGINAGGPINGVSINNDKGVALNSLNSPLITRGWDPFDQTAKTELQGLGRWGMFMEPYHLVLGIPDLPGRYFEVSRYWLNGARTPLMTVDQGGNVWATSFNPTSDQGAKENFTPVNPSEILAKVLALPLTRWNYKQDSAAPHIGPMGQDFRAAFGLGTDEKHIATVDADGVALAAIQGLDQVVETQRIEITKQKDLLMNQQTKIDKLERRLAELESRLGK